MVDGHDVELWQHARRIAKFEHGSKSPRTYALPARGDVPFAEPEASGDTRDKYCRVGFISKRPPSENGASGKADAVS